MSFFCGTVKDVRSCFISTEHSLPTSVVFLTFHDASTQLRSGSRRGRAPKSKPIIFLSGCQILSGMSSDTLLLPKGTATPTVGSPTHFAGTSQPARSRCAYHCRGVRSGPLFYCELQSQSSWRICLVLLWCFPGMSRTDWSPLEVTHRRFAPLLVVRLLCMMLPARCGGVLVTFT